MNIMKSVNSDEPIYKYLMVEFKDCPWKRESQD